MKALADIVLLMVIMSLFVGFIAPIFLFGCVIASWLWGTIRGTNWRFDR